MASRCAGGSRPTRATAHIPVVMVTALDQPSDRVKGLEAGADDFLTKPVNDIALMARVRSLVAPQDDDRRAAHAGRDVARDRHQDPMSRPWPTPAQRRPHPDRRRPRSPPTSGCRGMLVDRSTRSTVETNPSEALFRAGGRQLRSDHRLARRSTTSTPCGCAARSARSSARAACRSWRSAEADDNARLLRGLDIGVNDYLMRPDRPQRAAGARAHPDPRKRYADRLRDNVQLSIEMAITDALTGLTTAAISRRHLAHAGRAGARRAASRCRCSCSTSTISRRSTTAMATTRATTCCANSPTRMRKSHARHRSRLPLRRRGVRRRDAGHRHGGCDDRSPSASRRRIASRAFSRSSRARAPIDVTVSIGVAALDTRTTRRQTILKRADQALYRAKRDGRNRVVADAA